MPLGVVPPVRYPRYLKFPASSSSSSSSSCKGSRQRSSSVIIIRGSSLEQQKRGTDAHYTSSSCPLRTAEELASRLGLEMAVAGLERLFQDPPCADGLSPGRRPVRVAYQGNRGSYCQEAATKAFSSVVSCEAFPCSTHMEDAFLALEDGSADLAVVPAENSIDGPIDRNLDLLLRHPAVKIVGELVLPVNHCLLSLPGAHLRRVVSHPQALSHCQERLGALDIDIEEVSNAAEAAKFVAENRIYDTAVIGSKIAAKEFGLQVLEQSFQDRASGNFNRFFQLGLRERVAWSNSGAQKTTVAFTLKNGVSDLFRAMRIFESCGVEVTRVDHRPNGSSPVRLVEEVVYLDYVFILDLEGNESDPSVDLALAGLRDMATFARVLGTYASTCGSSDT